MTVCDDEYWEAEDPFRQPEGKPSYMAFWTHYILLIEILGFAQRSIVCLNPCRYRPHSNLVVIVLRKALRSMGTNTSFCKGVESESCYRDRVGLEQMDGYTTRSL